MINLGSIIDMQVMYVFNMIEDTNTNFIFHYKKSSIIVREHFCME